MTSIQQVLTKHLSANRFVHWLVAVTIGLIIVGQSPSIAKAAEPLHVLLQRIEAPSSFTEGLLAAEAVRVYGQHAMPRLTQLLRHEDDRARQFAALACVRMGPTAAPAIGELIAALERRDEVIRRDVIVALTMIGPAAAPAIPALRNLVDDPDVRLAGRAIQALAAIGTPEALQALTAFLHIDRRELRSQTLAAIRDLGPAAVSLRPDVLQFGMIEPDCELSELALSIVGRWGEEALDSFVELLEADSPETRRRAAKAIYGMRTDGSGAARALQRSIADPDENVRFWAARTLGTFEVIDPETQSALMKATADPSPDVCWAAADALRRHETDDRK
jgi:HEAT repeat protein